MKNIISSMTGFGCQEQEMDGVGRISVELRCTNHKFFETVFHLPEGMLALEDRLKKDLEGSLKRGRVFCAVNIKGHLAQGVFVNRKLLKNYLREFNSIKKEFGLKDELTLDALTRLPGILALKEDRLMGGQVWDKLQPVFARALKNLIAARQKEGDALVKVLRKMNLQLKQDLAYVKQRFALAVKNKLKDLHSEEERAAFLKDTDITEEIDRLHFHTDNFWHRLAKGGAVGKELDFITQEMQREANTLAAKSFDLAVSARAVGMKSQIEKIREQVQNIE